MADLQRVRSFSSTVLKSPPHLILRTEAASHQLLLDVGNCWTFGRGSDNTFTLPDRWASRSHAMLQRTDDGEYYLIDLGSRNGTFVNGRRVSIPVRLRHSDRLTIGQTDLVFYSPMQVQREESLDFDTEDGATAVLSLRRLISVMVVDIRQFTVLTRQLDEQVLSELIGTWFRQAGNIIRDAGSWVDKYIGDAVMAVWFHKSEVASPEEVRNICQALSALSEMTQALNTKYTLPFPLKIGAGINTGYAMVGNTGSGDRPDYTALGDTVNAAFRLESATKEIGKDIALGETTFKALSALPVDCSALHSTIVNLKGYDQPTQTFACTFEDLMNIVTMLASEELRSS
ncbi:MAG: adenylate/guanylate cyclase domain-containing protein [Oscillatoriales cyanobacterium]|nr:MAG: adenylate/guanylate cyclase domain-containing protein [Oscillatoriales cyanobacterium]